MVADADLSPERRFAGTKSQGLATYKKHIKNLSTKSRPDGDALLLILEKWISGIQSSVKAQTGAEGDEFYSFCLFNIIYLFSFIKASTISSTCLLQNAGPPWSAPFIA